MISHSPLSTSRGLSSARGQRLVNAQSKGESPALPGLLVSIPAPTGAIPKRAKAGARLLRSARAGQLLGAGNEQH
jgi:hypothetical protein